MSSQSNTFLHEDVDGPTDAYHRMYDAAEKVAEMLSTAVVTPVAKEHFRQDRGHPLNQTLPDKSDSYTFESHGFSADVFPDERHVTNHAYEGKALTAERVASSPADFRDAAERAEEMWWDAFGEWRQMSKQPDHPGPFPIDADSIDEAVDAVEGLREHALDGDTLETAAEAARKEDFGFLVEMFDTTREEIFTPGGTDLTAVRFNDDIRVPYNDGNLAVFRPVNESDRPGTPTRGVIVGHDDTPVGIFAHAVDVTNLSPDQTTTHDAIRDAMGFDSEINPFNPPAELHVGDDERVRLQGDLRVERAGDLDQFPDEHARRTRIDLYREAVDELLDGVRIPKEYVISRGRSGVPVKSAFDASVTSDGDASLDPTVSDNDVELLAYAELLFELGEGPAGAYDDYTDIDYVVDDPADRSVWSVADDTRAALQRAREEVRASITGHLDRHRDRIEREARNAAAEAEAGIDVPQQVNLPIDNHMAFIEDGFAPDVDTEPVPVAVPEETTLHIIHDEHNTVTVQIDPGVYRFSLLPRGLQPPGQRPRWPSP